MDATKIETIKNIFRQADSTGQGIITLDKMKAVFTKIGMSESYFEVLSFAFVKTSASGVKYEDFVDFVFRGIEKKEEQKNDLAAAALLLDNCELIRKKLPGLGAALLQLQAMEEPPEDATLWISKQLLHGKRASLTHGEVTEYSESVLEGLVMKCDEFAGIHLLKSERLHPEAWNFRKTDMELPIYGSGQCHLDGIAYLAKHLKSEGYNRVFWFNMREEPVVFLSGQACAPRSAENLNENVDWLMSVESHELDALEKRLVRDCIEAAGKAESKTLGVLYQLASGSNEEKQLPVEADKSFTVRSAFEWLNTQDGVSQLTYSRVPIADETAPEEGDFDQLVMELKSVALSEMAKDVALVFNCQMGRGRTTTGMVCGSILLLAGRGWTPPDGAPDALPAMTAEGRDLKRGEFKCILHLLALIDQAYTRRVPTDSLSGRGLKAKLLADKCIDSCAHAQNMVEAIIACENSAASAEPGGSRPPEFWRARARAYVHRYAHMLLFAAYALEEVNNGFQSLFSEWLHRHWEFKRIIKGLSLE